MDRRLTVKMRKGDKGGNLPRECLLHKVYIRLMYLIPNGTADVVAQRTTSADHDGHLAHLRIDLHVQQGIDIGYTAKN